MVANKITIVVYFWGLDELHKTFLYTNGGIMMQSSLKKSLYLGLAALGFVAVAGSVNANNASAKTYAKVTSNEAMTTAKSSRNVTFNGSNALYTKAGTLKGAKVVASTTTLKKLAASKNSQDNFEAYRVAVTDRGSVYYKVVSFDKQYRGWIYGGKSTSAFAGGLEAYTTFKEGTVTDAQKTGYYNFAKTGTTNDGTMLTYKDPMYTIYGSGRVIKDSTANAKDLLQITKVGTRTREGDTWVYVNDVTTPAASGWILESGLTKTADVPASEGVTVNYVDKATGKVVKSIVIPFSKTGVNADNKDVMDIVNNTDAHKPVADGMPEGYSPVKGGFYGNETASKESTMGSTQVVYVSQNDKTATISPIFQLKTTGANLWSVMTSDQQAAFNKLNTEAQYQVVQGTVLPGSTTESLIKAAGLDQFKGTDGNTYKLDSVADFTTIKDDTNAAPYAYYSMV